MRVVSVAMVLFLFVQPALAAGASYPELLTRLKAGDTAIDFEALRFAYADSDSYDPFADGPEGARRGMRDAFRAGDCAGALSRANAILDEVYIDIEAHIVASRCSKGDAMKSAFHNAVATGLERSILDGHDGETMKSAFVVVRISEEYHVLGAMRLDFVSQALVTGEGHAFDLMTATDDKGARHSVYFQIDRVLAGENRMFAPK